MELTSALNDAPGGMEKFVTRTYFQGIKMRCSGRWEKRKGKERLEIMSVFDLR